MNRVIAFMGLAAMSGQAIATPLDDALRAAGGSLCFTRTYDAAWLKAHRGQTVRSVEVALDGDRPFLRMVIRGKGAPLYLGGECRWYEGDLNRGVQNDVLDPSFKPTSGVGCHLYTDITGGSAEEGGDFPVEWGKGYIQVHLPDSVAAWRSTDVRRQAGFYDLAPADRIVRLNQVPASRCRALVKSFAPDGLL